jgi:hypothetical protein
MPIGSALLGPDREMGRIRQQPPATDRCAREAAEAARGAGLRLLVNMAAGVPVIVAGVLLLTSGAGEGLHWLADGIVITLVTAVWNAWVLLVEILR